MQLSSDRKVGDGFREGRVLLRAGTSRLSLDTPEEAEGLAAESAGVASPIRSHEDVGKMPKRPGVRSVIRRRHRQGAKTAR